MDINDKPQPHNPHKRQSRIKYVVAAVGGSILVLILVLIVLATLAVTKIAPSIQTTTVTIPIIGINKLNCGGITGTNGILGGFLKIYAIDNLPAICSDAKK